jgi:hypothetical protein
MMLVHHRQPTASLNSLDQTHPILVANDCLEHDYLVVHNGVLHNDDELKKKHEGLGFEYLTAYDEIQYSGTVIPKFNDSECVAIETARYIENHVTEADIDGSCAFVALQIDKKTQKVLRVFFGRNDRNPLNLDQEGTTLCLSSEGKGDNIKPDILYSFEPKGKMTLEERPLLFTKKVEEKKSWHGWEKKDTKTVTPTDTAYQSTSQFLEDEDWGKYQGPADTFIGNYRNDYLETAEEDIHKEVEDFLGLLDWPESVVYADVESTVKAIRAYLEDAKSKISEKYALEYAKHPPVSDEGGDTPVETCDGRPLLEAPERVENP